MTTLTEWQNFYVIVGSSAGALIGLQFVVIALISNSLRTREQAQAGASFVTPTVVHFGTALLVAAAMSMPRPGVAPVVLFWGLTGIGGVLYALMTTRQLQSQTVYKPEFEDWLFHAVLPIAAYALLIAAAFAGFFIEGPALFGVAAATLLLLFAGIHNAWDTVTYHVFTKKHDEQG
jgi:uncharacterized membrane protein